MIEPQDPAEFRQIEASLSERFRVTTTSVDLGGHVLTMLHPRSADELIDAEAFDRDERLPYWAELWPSARVLGAYVLAEDGHDRTMMELGCGVGLVAVCATLAGYRVTATDYYADALAFTRLNVFRNTGRGVLTHLLDWRSLPETLVRADRVVGSDLLYERPYGPLVARAVLAALRAGGSATIADPGRVGRESFLAEGSAIGLEVDVPLLMPYTDGAIHQSIALFHGRPTATA